MIKEGIGRATGKVLGEFYQSDANYIAERIRELHRHAMLHQGEICAKLNRARIGGMIEVLGRMGLEVDCAWEQYLGDIHITTDMQLVERKLKKSLKEGK
jgi:hypothetical protein